MLIRDLCQILNEIAPIRLAESWDNVGLLAGDEASSVERVMTCLTITDVSLDEAIAERADLVISHHPIPFKPLNRITSHTTTGRLLLKAIRANVAIYSPHTAWDNAPHGINRQLATMLAMQSPIPLTLAADPDLAKQGLGTGIHGKLSRRFTLEELVQKLELSLPSIRPRTTHPLQQTISNIGIVCGSGGSMIGLAAQRGCDAFLTGEATYHQCLEAEALGVAMVMIGHFASEFFAMRQLADMLSRRAPEIHFWASVKDDSQF